MFEPEGLRPADLLTRYTPGSGLSENAALGIKGGSPTMQDQSDGADLYFGHNEVEFHLVIDEGSLVREILESIDGTANAGSYEVVNERYVTRLVGELKPVAGSLKVVPEPYTGGKAGGPIPDQTYVVNLIGVASDLAGRLADFVALGIIIRGVIGKLRSITHNEVAVSDGCAIVLAAEAIFESTARRDLTLAFVTPLHDFLIDAGGGQGSDAGFMVGFRDRHELFVVQVSRTGAVSLAGTPIPLSRSDQEDPDPSHDGLWASIFDVLPDHWTASAVYEHRAGSWEVRAYRPDLDRSTAGTDRSIEGHGPTPEAALLDLLRNLREGASQDR